MLGNYRAAAQLVVSRVVLSSRESVTFTLGRTFNAKNTSYSKACQQLAKMEINTELHNKLNAKSGALHEANSC
jgi:hypothetical protein